MPGRPQHDYTTLEGFLRRALKGALVSTDFRVRVCHQLSNDEIQLDLLPLETDGRAPAGEMESFEVVGDSAIRAERKGWPE